MVLIFKEKQENGSNPVFTVQDEVVCHDVITTLGHRDPPKIQIVPFHRSSWEISRARTLRCLQLLLWRDDISRASASPRVKHQTHWWRGRNYTDVHTHQPRLRYPPTGSWYIIEYFHIRPLCLFVFTCMGNKTNNEIDFNEICNHGQWMSTVEAIHIIYTLWRKTF